MKFDFKASDGELLSGRLEMPVGTPKGFAVFAHCFTCSKNISVATSVARGLSAKGIATLRFDFTGLGNSGGDFSNTNFSSNVADVIAACKALSNTYEAPSILIGHSLGGAAVLKASASLPGVKAVVTIGAPSSVDHVSHLFKDSVAEIEQNGFAEVELGGRNFRIQSQFLKDLSEVSLLEGLKKQKKAYLIMHAPHDEIVSIDHAEKIYKSLSHPKSFVGLDTADHLVSKPVDSAYISTVIEAWVGRYASTGIPETPKPVGMMGEQVVVMSRSGSKFTHDIFTKDHHLTGDEPVTVGGDNLGPAPYEFLLSSLGTCSAMTMKMYAARKEYPLEGVKVTLTHQKRTKNEDDPSAGTYDSISKLIEFEGDLSEEQVRKMKAIAERCPVNLTLQSDIQINQID